ncbi:type I restriction enzyme ZgaDII, R subunit [Rhodonellum psychrophilum GCM71 = DSM 17998]|uniref:Type I restriction enzyme endonuclease subunit n=2 Tax=Rhodonellum TaxID=336827 RepID=U5BT92_9BACT|nr:MULTISPECIES: type I restriction endonuclease subunit R [Rhodonellum]ERM81123.1 type I restriction enzyme ZgaDII, R subunit [Rhodonellum psychrophilum GCM71 = DSM 17998]SDZ51544.1 type I restriction enzyme, R subunit [Rhodonellum ikkaensis]
MSKMIEITVQKAAIVLLQDLGYVHQEGNALKRDLKKVVLADELRRFLESTYPDVPATAIKEALVSFTQHQGMDTDHRNRDFHRKMTQGISVSWKDAKGKEQARHLYPIHYGDPLKNRFICADEMTIIGKNTRRTDLLIYINGLPLVLFEFKNMFDKETGVDNAHRQIGHYGLDIPQLFDYNAISIVSDGLEALHGMYNAALEWYAPWKSLEGDDIEQDQALQLETLINGLFPKATLLNYLRNFIFHEDHNGKIIKKGAKYHQYWGVDKAVNSALENIKPHGDGRLGVVWHTQGSGKSISMAILTGILRQLPEMKNPTILIQVDRSDLDQQLYENFVLCKDLVGDVQHADTTDDLRKLLSSDGGGVIFTTIEKFRLKDLENGKETAHPVLSERYNLIVMADEAHRTQYGFNDGGFAQNIRRALPNASFIGFTGTPVDGKDADTQLVFGKTIHTYDIKQAVEDGATVPIYYEPKMVPLNIKGEYSRELEEVAEGAEESSNAVWAAVEDAAGAEERVAKVAAEILKHYGARTATLDGKAMIICMSRRNCVKMYDAITALEGCPEVAVIMTSNVSKDPLTWNPHVRTKESMEAVKKRFRTPDDALKIVIVRDMWLTGFDAPSAHTLYVDKIMKGHNLMQAIARVNRVFKEKPNGLVVDFIGISGFLAAATKKYTGSGGEGKPTLNIEVAVNLCLEQFDIVKDLLEDFDIESIKLMADLEKMKWSNTLVNKLLRSDPITDKFLQEERKLTELVAMCNSDERIWPIQEEVAVIQKIRHLISKIKSPPGPQRQKNDRIKDLISKSIESHAIVDLASMYDLDQIDISIIDDRFQAIVKEKGGENIKIELLRRIINDELKVRMHKNIKRNRSLKEELERVLGQYHKNSLDSIAAIKHLLDIATEFKNDDIRTRELGLTEDELAFYDLLSANEKLLNEKGPIQDLVHKVVASVKRNLQLDWTKKEDARAAIRLAVKKELRGKVQFSALDQLLQEVIEQAEGQYGDWVAEG